MFAVRNACCSFLLSRLSGSSEALWRVRMGSSGWRTAAGQQVRALVLFSAASLPPAVFVVWWSGKDGVFAGALFLECGVALGRNGADVASRLFHNAEVIGLPLFWLAGRCGGITEGKGSHAAYVFGQA